MKLNRKGFTLVELLVTIVIIALVAGFSIFGIINVINDSEEEVTVLSESNLKEAANIYSTEMGNTSWKKTNNYDAFCVTIGELMNKGLLDKNAIIKDKDITKDTFIIVKRNNITLAIEKEEIVSSAIGDENNNICTGQVNIDGENYTKPNIGTSVNYTDKIEIPFTSGTSDSGVSSYKCLYGDSSSSVNKEGKVEGNKCILSSLKNNKDYYVMIYMNTNKGSSVLADGSNNYTTSDFNNTTFSQNKNIITVKYNTKDTKGNSINSPSYYFKSTIEGTSNIEAQVCTFEDNKYTCTGSTNNIKKDTWYKVSNNEVNITYPEENNEVKIDTRIYDGSNNYKANDSTFKINKYTVRFYKNSASSIDGSTEEYITRYCIAGGTDSCSITAPSIEALVGYSALGWNTSNSATSSSWSVNTSKSINSNYDYYAILKIHTVTIKYNTHGGSVRSTTTWTDGTEYNWEIDDTGLIYRNGGLLTHVINYGDKLSVTYGLQNYNNSNSLYVTKNGYKAVEDAEWKCLSGCSTSDKTFNQVSAYGDSEFCDSSLGDCTVTLGVNWIARDYTISYNLNGGSVSGNPTSYTVESSEITLNNPTKTGYTFSGWTGTNGTTPSTSVSIASGSTGNKSYTANWKASSYSYNIVYKSSSGVSLGTGTISYDYGTTNSVSPKAFDGYTSPDSQSIKWDSTSAKTITFTYTPVSYSITYNLNGGSVSGNPTTYTIESNKITLNNPSKTGYTFSGWTGANGTTPSTSVSIEKGSTGNKSYTANWKASTYTITYNANGGSGAPGSQTASVGVATTLSSTIPTRIVATTCNSHSNYVFLGWSTDSSATSASYSPSSSFVNNSSSNITLYAVWEADSVRFAVSNNKVTVYQITSCTTSGTCTYNQLNGSSSSGTISKSSLYVKDSIKSWNNGIISLKDFYMVNERTPCYCTPSTSSSQKQNFPWCETWMNNTGTLEPNTVTIWETSVSGWYYSRTYDCYIPTSSLTKEVVATCSN